MRLISSLVIFVFVGQLQASGQKLEFKTGDKNLGWHFIIWTTDSSKCSPRKKPPLSFDQNNVVYLHTAFQNPHGIKILNEKGEDISGQMREIMRSAHTVRFYRPTDAEIRSHPTLSSEEASIIYMELEKKGYVTEDPSIK